MDKESRNAFTVVGAVLVALLAIGVIFSGSPDDAVVGDAPAAHGEAGPAEGEVAEDVHEDVAEEEVAAAEPAADEAGTAPEGVPGDAPEEVPAEVTALEPSEETLAEEALEGEAAGVAEADQAEEAEVAAAESEEVIEEVHEDVALAGDPAAGERVFRQCQACHQVGEGAENRVGPLLTGVVGRTVASVEGFTYSDTLAALGQEGLAWTPDELRSFLANPREYAPGTAMAYAGVRSEDDLENLIAYLATAE